jgi:hypothetical protein
MDTPNGRVAVRGLEVFEVADALSAAAAMREEAGWNVEPYERAHLEEDRRDFEIISLRVAAEPNRRAQDRWVLDVYDTEGLRMGLPQVEARTREQLARDDLTRPERRQLTAKLKRLTRIREGVAALATENGQ